MIPPGLLIDARALALPWPGETLPLAVIDLAAVGDECPAPLLPPFPLVGVGARSHPFAAHLDAVIEPPVALAPLVANVRAQPHAAAVAVQLLRLIEGAAPGPALVAESLAYGLLQGSAGHADWLASREPVAASPGGAVAVERDGEALRIRLERVGARNAIDRAMRDALREAFELAVLDPDIRKVELRGAGKAFCVGADLAEFGTTRDPATAHTIRMATLPAHAIARCADKLKVHVHGACVGAGLEMAAFARRIVAAPDAWFQLPELAMGLIPGAGGCVSLARRIGRQRTVLMILSGRRIGARTALGWGLVDALVDERAADQRRPHVA